MSHRFTQSGITTRYEIKLSTIIRDFGLTAYTWISQNLRDVKTALEETRQKDIIPDYTVEKTVDVAQRSKLTDAKSTITPHPNFSGVAVAANTRQKRIEKTVGTKSQSSFIGSCR